MAQDNTLDEAFYQTLRDVLSPLQRAILLRAFDNRYREHRTAHSSGCDCYYYEILAHEWGFEDRWAGARQRMPERWHFRQRQIPSGQYNSALASLSRAVRRLAARGLVTRHRGQSWRGTWAGVTLTPVGLPVAERMWEGWLARRLLARSQTGSATGATAVIARR